MRTFAGPEDSSNPDQSCAISGAANPRKLHLAVLCLSSLLIASINLPTLSTPFDFADDGAFVHSQGVTSFTNFHEMVWFITGTEFTNKGPYRPVAWYFWVGQQELFGEDSLQWRGSRFLWTWIAAAAFLWLLREIGFGMGVAILTTAVAMWNPYRAEVWMSLTHCEGIAMPFAMAGLVCAYRAARSEQSWRWDLAAMACAVLAVGCKNVFAVMIPAQMFLRVCEPHYSLGDGVKRHGWRAALLGCTVVLPVVHFICYRLTMHANRYDLAWDDRQPLRMLNALLGGMGKDFLGPAIAAAILLVAWSWWRGTLAAPADGARAESDPARDRAALGTGLILFFLGWGVYAPMQGVAGRYTFPGVWGLDLLCALLWTRLARTPPGLRNITYALVGCGLLACVLANVGKQEKNTARLTALWEALSCVEERVPTGSHIGWVGVADRKKTEDLEIGEGIHFRWHLEARGRRDLRWQDDSIVATQNEPEFLITGSTTPPDFSPSSWDLLKECRHSYWFGRKEVICCVWRRAGSMATAAPIVEPAR